MSAAPAPFMTASEIERIIRGLPAEQRAQFQWAPQRYRQIIEQLLVEDPSPELIQRVAVEYVQFCFSWLQARNQVSRPLREGLLEDHPRVINLDFLKAYFRNSPLAEQVDWVCDVLVNVHQHLQADVSEASSEEPTSTFNDWEQPSEEAISQAYIGGFLGPQVLVAALVRGVELGRPPEQMEKLVERAYIETAHCVDGYAVRGIDLDPLHQLAPEQRFEKARRYIEELREVMTPEDVDTLSQARVTSL